MKKLLIITLTLSVVVLSACSLIEDNGNEENINQNNPVDVVDDNRDEEDLSSEPQVNSSVYSEELGIRVSYYSNPENKTISQVEGNRVYFYMDGPISVSGYKSGQYLEGFNKPAEVSLQSAIEERFLSGVARDKCFVTIIEDTDTYQKAIIDYPDTLCPNGSPAFTCHACPADYSKTNGIAYFMYYKNQPTTFFYFSIGQYSLIGSQAASGNLEWFDNIEFVR